MSKVYQKFIADLHLPEDIVSSLSIPRSHEEMRIFALSIPRLLYPDTYVLAGRLYIYLNTITAPRTMEDYVEITNGILRPEIADFMTKNNDILDKLLEETWYKNFEDHNILSASKCIDYLLKVSKEDPPIETPCQLMLRQAVQFYHDESIEKVVKCYREMVNQEYVHASPTMFNAGLRKNQMSSCFLLSIGDNLEDLLYTGAGDVGMISKLQGGIGLSMNQIRHSAISNTGKSSGVLPFARIYDSTIRCVDQGGKRNGAATISLNDWHIDIEDFIRSRDNYTHDGIRLVQTNTALFVSSLFMKRVRSGEKWTLFCPAKAQIGGDRLSNLRGDRFEELYLLLEKEVLVREENLSEIDEKVKKLEKVAFSSSSTTEIIKELNLLNRARVKIRKNLIDYKVVDARKMYELVCDMQVKSSFPYVVYADTMNYKNNTMNIGPTESSNLCLEITLPANPDSIASCNLGHVNLKRFVKTRKNGEKYYDYNHLGRATQSLVENIDKVVTFNYYPLDKRDRDGKVIEKGKIHRPNIENRPLGIGVSGLAEVFALLGYPYDSPESIIINKKIFAALYYNALYRSHLLAKEKGEYATFRTGECRLYADGEWKTFKGSPLSNGYFQFDLWKSEAKYLDSIGELQKEIYHPEDDKPIDPTAWGNDLPVDGWDELRKMIVDGGVRNSMLIALMPTASSAQMLRNAETTEAHQTLIYSRKLSHGNYISFSEPFVEDMIRLKLWNKKMIDFINISNGSIKDIHFFITQNPEFFPHLSWKEVEKNEKKLPVVFLLEVIRIQKLHKGMYEISQKTTAKMARQRGIYVCQSQSFNIYIGEPNKKTMQAIHLYTDALRLKTGMYYLRANPASQTGRFTVDLDVQKYHSTIDERRKRYICAETVCVMCQ